MKSKPSLQTIRKELRALQKYDTIIFGSYVTGDFTAKSDIDVAVITKQKNPDKNKIIWKSILGNASGKYHINVFELMPLHLKTNIINNHKVIFGNNLEITEYFYHFRKLWQDSKQRYYENQFKSVKEKIIANRINN